MAASKFIPAQATSSTLGTATKKTGQLIVTTDTKKAYLDISESQRVEICNPLNDNLIKLPGVWFEETTTTKYPSQSNLNYSVHISNNKTTGATTISMINHHDKGNDYFFNIYSNSEDNNFCTINFKSPTSIPAFSVSWTGKIRTAELKTESVMVHQGDSSTSNEWFALHDKRQLIYFKRGDSQFKVDLDSIREEGVYSFPNVPNGYSNMPGYCDSGILFVFYDKQTDTGTSSQMQYFIGCHMTTIVVAARQASVPCTGGDPSQITASWSSWRTLTSQLL